MLLCKDNWNSQDVGYSDANWVDSSIDQLFISGYYVFSAGEYISWKIKKHNIVFST